MLERIKINFEFPPSMWMNFGQKESFQRWKEFANRQLHSITLSRERYRKTRSYWHPRLHFNSVSAERNSISLTSLSKVSKKNRRVSQIKEKSVNAVRKRETIFDIEKREREVCIHIGIHNWNDVLEQFWFKKWVARSKRLRSKGLPFTRLKRMVDRFFGRGETRPSRVYRVVLRVSDKCFDVCRTRREKEREISYANARFAPDASSGHASLILNHRWTVFPMLPEFSFSILPF